MRSSTSPRPVTILDDAAAAKVSKSTVSLVLKESPLI
ncbi:MAG: LacI family DNA-binding transcriptional regulator, partial [Burkholderiales bacterium]|nr:LacI family DNA-binding transcriptional regulator [Burkholderiales bacterium]